MRSLTLSAAAAVLSSTGLAALPGIAQAGIVVASSGPSASSFPVGRKIADQEQIVLRAGDTLTVLDGNATRILRGAGTYSLGRSAPASGRSTFAILTERRSASRVRTGAVRTTEDEGPVHSPNLWYVDVDKPGTVCLADPKRVRLWRRDSAGQADYTIGTGNSGESLTASFADGEMLAPWNSRSLPVSEDTTYRIAHGGQEVEVRFALLDEVEEEPEGLAEQLIANGCTVQLDLLATAMAAGEAGGSG